MNLNLSHLRHLWPLPPGLDELFGQYKTIVVPELNMGQLFSVLRSEYPGHNFVSLPKVQGKPFMVSELVASIKGSLEN